MHVNTTAYAYKDTEVKGYILDVNGQGKTAYLQIGDEGGRVTFILMGKDSTDFLDKLANEAERLTREFIGDVPPLEPLRLGIEIDPIPMACDPAMGLPGASPTNAYSVLSARGVPVTHEEIGSADIAEDWERAQFSAYESEHDR